MVQMHKMFYLIQNYLHMSSSKFLTVFLANCFTTEITLGTRAGLRTGGKCQVAQELQSLNASDHRIM